MFADILSTSSTNAICRIRLFIIQQPKPLLLLLANHMCVTGLILEAKAAWSAWFSGMYLISTNNTPPFLMVNCQRHPARFCHCHVIHYFLCLHTYLSLIQLQHVAVALPIYVIVECNIKPFLFIFILAICEKELWSSLIYC